MQYLLLLLKFLPMVLEIGKLIQQHRLDERAQEEIIGDLTMTAEYLVTRADKARLEVKDTSEDEENDPFNRD